MVMRTGACAAHEPPPCRQTPTRRSRRAVIDPYLLMPAVLDGGVKGCANRRRSASSRSASRGPRSRARKRRAASTLSSTGSTISHCASTMSPGQEAGVTGHRRLEQPGIGGNLVDGFAAGRQLDRLQVIVFTFLAYGGAERDDLFGVEADADVVVRVVDAIERAMNRWGGSGNWTITSVAVLARHFPARIKNRHIGPSPGIDLQPHGREGFDLDLGGDALFLAIAAVLAADHAARTQRPDRAEHLDLFVADAVGRVASGRLHSSIETTWSMWFWTTSRMAPASS